MTLLTVPPDALAGLSADATALAADAWRTKAIAKLSVPIGILSGLIAGAFYNRYATIRLPEYLAFFGGRRFVPILSGVAGPGLALLFGGLSTPLDNGMASLSTPLTGSGAGRSAERLVRKAGVIPVGM